MKTIVLDGNNFSDMGSFYDEVKRKFCPNMDGFGRNLMAFNDVLRGGFGVFEYGESIMIIWQNSAKSESELNQEEQVKLQQRLQRLEKTRERMRAEHLQQNLGSINKAINEAQKGLAPNRGATPVYDQLAGNAIHGQPIDRKIFDLLVDIIRDHADHVELVLE